MGSSTLLVMVPSVPYSNSRLANFPLPSPLSLRVQRQPWQCREVSRTAHRIWLLPRKGRRWKRERQTGGGGISVVSGKELTGRLVRQ